MHKKKRKPFQPQTKVRALTGGERERSKDHVRWILALSRNDIQVYLKNIQTFIDIYNLLDHPPEII